MPKLTHCSQIDSSLEILGDYQNERVKAEQEMNQAS